MRAEKSCLNPKAKTLCLQYSVPVPKLKVTLNLEEAVRASEEIGFPVVVKIISRDIIHKSDAGCVKLNVENPEAVREAYKQVTENAFKFDSKAKIEGILVEEMLPRGIEVAVGGIKDVEFGPTVMFGLGGVFIEVLKDMSFRVAPISEDEAREMIREVEGFKLLQGYRGIKPVDLNVLVEILVKTSRLLLENPEINQLDFNPIICWNGNAKVADARIIIG